MSREIGIEDAVVEHGEATGWITRKMAYAGRRGCRDRDFYGYGEKVFVEFKQRGKGFDPHQERERKRLAEVGVIVHLIDNVADGIALLDRLRGV